MNMLNKTNKSPRFPIILATPLKLLPEKVHSRFLVKALNRILLQQIKEGDVDFLNNRCLCVKVNDVNIQYNLSLSQGRLIALSSNRSNDLMIQANLYDFLMLAAREEDSDTLVFQRRLLMQGDTELGLELKNFLDGLDIESSSSFTMIERILKKSLPVYSRLFS